MFSSHTSSISLLVTVFMLASGCVSVFLLADRQVRNSAGVHLAQHCLVVEPKTQKHFCSSLQTFLAWQPDVTAVCVSFCHITL